MRVYAKEHACGFRLTRKAWGEFSNFHPLAAPIAAGPFRFATSEALYQAAKFSARPDVQRRIAGAPTPKEAAAIGRTPGLGIDPGWNAQRVDVMRWVLRMKREADRAGNRRGAGRDRRSPGRRGLDPRPLVGRATGGGPLRGPERARAAVDGASPPASRERPRGGLRRLDGTDPRRLPRGRRRRARRRPGGRLSPLVAFALPRRQPTTAGVPRVHEESTMHHHDTATGRASEASPRSGATRRAPRIGTATRATHPRSRSPRRASPRPAPLREVPPRARSPHRAPRWGRGPPPLRKANAGPRSTYSGAATSSRRSSGVSMCAIPHRRRVARFTELKVHLDDGRGRRVVVLLVFGLMPRDRVVAPDPALGRHGRADFADRKPREIHRLLVVLVGEEPRELAVPSLEKARPESGLGVAVGEHPDQLLSVLLVAGRRPPAARRPRGVPLRVAPSPNRPADRAVRRVDGGERRLGIEHDAEREARSGPRPRPARARAGSR